MSAPGAGPDGAPYRTNMQAKTEVTDDLAFQAWCLPLIDRFLVDYPWLPPMMVSEQVQLVAGSRWAGGTDDDALMRTADAVRDTLDALTRANAARSEMAALDVRRGIGAA